MRRTTRLNVVVLLLALIAACIVWVVTPTQYLADQQTPIALERNVPMQLQGWKALAEPGVHIVDPVRQEIIDAIYTETLTRSYVNPEGYRIMLSVAYGKDQRDGLNLHLPEVCYPAQGFMVNGRSNAMLDIDGVSPLAVRQLQTRLGQRVEPVTYWTVIGDTVYQGGTSKKKHELRYALSDQIADGMLVRISSIDQDTTRAYAMHLQFAAALVAALPPSVRARFAGH